MILLIPDFGFSDFEPIMGYDVNAIMDSRHEDCYQHVTEHHKHTHTPNLSRLYFLSVCSLVIQSLSMNVVGNVAQGKHLVIEITLYVFSHESDCASSHFLISLTFPPSTATVTPPA